MLKAKIDELNESNEYTDYDIRIIKAVTPINMRVITPKNDSGECAVIGVLTWLCKDINDHLFCLISSYVAEDEEDQKYLLTSPMLEDRYFINYRTASDMLLCAVPQYITNFDFVIDDINDFSDDTNIYCYAVQTSGKKSKIAKLMMSPECFGTLKFVDRYLLEATTNNADLYSAILFGPDETNNTSIFKVNNLDISGMCKIKKHKDIVAIKLLLEYSTKHTTDKKVLLLPLDIGEKLHKSKFRGMTFDKIRDGYFSDEYQYISRYMFKLKSDENDAEDYIFIRAANNKNDGIIFVLPPSVVVQLIDQINLY